MNDLVYRKSRVLDINIVINFHNNISDPTDTANNINDINILFNIGRISVLTSLINVVSKLHAQPIL